MRERLSMTSQGYAPGQTALFPTRRITGDIQKVKKLQLPGHNQHLLVAHIKTDDGRNVLVNLGPAEQVPSLNLQEGEEITVAGPGIHLGNLSLVLANRVRHHGKTTPIEAFTDIEPQWRNLNGTLNKVEKIQVSGIDQPMVLGLLKTDQGKQVVVNFSPSGQVRTQDLQQGQQISVQGPFIHVDGVRFLLAEQAHTGGQGQSGTHGQSGAQSERNFE